jgi:tRNA (guanine37-N1)-methyltransferase
MKISVITLFPEIFESVFAHSIAARTLKSEKATIEFVNLRNFGLGAHKTVDDKPYGGGVGMVMRVDVVHAAIEATRTQKGNEKVVLMDPIGTPYKQKTALELASLDHLIIVCGHYEGIDARIRNYVDEIISIGDYVLSGGEIGAIVVIDSILRLIPGALKHTAATENESFSEIDGQILLESPQYTRPDEYDGQKVPEILKKGNHGEIKQYRQKEAEKLTKKNRADLLKS